MKVSAKGICLCAVAIAMSVSACGPMNGPTAAVSNADPEAQRIRETRVFATGDKRRVVQAVLGALEDQGCTLFTIDYERGFISAARKAMRISIFLVPVGHDRYSVRASARVMPSASSPMVDDPAFYRSFIFDPVSKELSLPGKIPEAGADQ